MNALRKRLGGQKIKFWICIVLGVYFGSYLMLSLFGRYQDNMASLEKIHMGCLCISDRDEWQPKSIIVTSFPGNQSSLLASPLGYLYLPIVFFDRVSFHPTHYYESYYENQND
jgi:hypothetical protein